MTPTQDNPGPGLPARRRRTLSTLLHRLALLLTLAVGAGVLVYNAFSIVNGDGGLVAVPMFSGGTVAGPVAAPHG
jgi:hypothetical protein